MPESRPALVGIFADPEVVLKAADAAMERGWRDANAITPYSLERMHHTLRLKPSWIPWVTLVFGLLGAFGGWELQVWTQAVDWPQNIGGKPFISWPAFIPITFECGILIGGIATFIALWIACRMPVHKPKILDERLTDDKFALLVPLTPDAMESAVSEFLKGAGADEVLRVDM